MVECGVCYEDKRSDTPRSNMDESMKSWFSHIDGSVCTSCYNYARLRVVLRAFEKGVRKDFEKLNEKLDELNEKLD